MSWDSRWYPTTPKRPPPADGIKVKKLGTTWWGQRWIEALERMSHGYSSRLARGRTYARAGRTHALVVAAGVITAKVTGSRPTPYAITIELAKLSEAAWAKAYQAMAQKAQFAAELLGGQMPKDIDEAFREGGASLFPEREADLVTSCSCPDWANPCKHVAATHYVLGEALDRDPFLLFELRGRPRDGVLEALRHARSGGAKGLRRGRAAAPRGGAEEPSIAGVALGALTPEDYERARGPLPALHLSFEAPAGRGALLRQLGVPASWSGEVSPADRLAPLVEAAAERARRIALSDPAEREAPPPARENPRANADAAVLQEPKRRARRKKGRA